MFQFIKVVLVTILNFINNLGAVGLGIGMLLESACIPVPSEIVLPLGGFMVADGRLSLLEANVSVAIGSMTGSLIAYMVGYIGGRPFILKYGKYFFVSKEHFYQAEKVFNKFGAVTVFIGRLLPVIRTFISLPCGIAKMNIRKFIIYSLGGMIFWNFILIYLGFKFGQNYEIIVRPVYQKFEYFIIALIGLLLAFILYKFIKKNKKKRYP